MTIINNKYLFDQNEDKASNSQTARFAVITRLLIEIDLREIKKVMKIKK